METNEKRLSRAARRKLSIAAKRTAKKKAKKRALLKKRPKSPKKIKAAAEKAAKNVLVKKITGGQSYANLSFSQKQQVDKKIDAKKGLIAKVARKMLPVIKKKERERLRKIRGNDKQLNENHKVLTMSINGSNPEVSAYEKEGKILPYIFKTKEDAKKHCKKVGGKPFQSPKTEKFYVEFTKIDGPNDMNENENEENLKDLKAILDVAKMLSDKSPYFKGRGSKKEYIKMLVHKIQKLSEAKKQKLMTKMDAYKKVRKPVMPKSRPMKNKKTYDRKDLKKGRYD